MLYSDYQRLATLQNASEKPVPIDTDKIRVTTGKPHRQILTPSLAITIIGMCLGALTLIFYSYLCIAAYFASHDVNGRVIAVNLFFIGLGLSWLISRVPIKVQLGLVFATTIILSIAYFTPAITVPPVLYRHVIILYFIYALGLAFSELHIYTTKKRIWNNHTEGKHAFTDSMTRIIPLIDTHEGNEVVRKYHAEDTTNTIIRNWHYEDDFYSFSARNSYPGSYVDEVLLAGKNMVLVFSITPRDDEPVGTLNNPDREQILKHLLYYRTKFPKHHVSAYCVVYKDTKNSELTRDMLEETDFIYIRPQDFNHISDALFFSYAHYAWTDRNTIITLLSMTKHQGPVKQREEKEYFIRRY